MRDETATIEHTVRPLDASTWDAVAELVERNGGIFGGCWCISFHPECGQRDISYRAVKEERVRTDRAHAALVLDADGLAQGWCQYGSPEELPNIKHRRVYEQDAPPRPDWRITCFYVDKRHRGHGIARAGLEGALDRSHTRAVGSSRPSPRSPPAAKPRAASSSAPLLSCSKSTDSRADARSASMRGS